MPWKYNATVFVGGEEIQFSNAEVVNISGPGRMIGSGRVFAPKYTPKVIPTLVIIPTLPPQAEASVCVPTTPIEAPASYM